MPNIAAVATIQFQNKISQEEVKKHSKDLFLENFPQVERMLAAFDNTEIKTRNFCKPLSYYAGDQSFEQRNNDYINLSVEYTSNAITEASNKAGFILSDLTDIVFVSSTGLATPSIDALLINKLRLSPYLGRTPIWGLGCGGGVSGLAKVNAIAKANPKAIVVFVCVELCSLTLIKTDYSKSNFIGSSLFSDGVSAAIILGDEITKEPKISIVNCCSKLYYDTIDIMGWEFQDAGFKVVFSKDIPSFIHENIKNDIDDFLQVNGLTIDDIKNFIFHPGGKKVIDAYNSSLDLKDVDLQYTAQIMQENGNMSSATVIYVLERFMSAGYEPGYGLMLAMGPGFSSEMILLKMNA
ncbi:MAG: 3-oxoacyl-[acyl-carrier-protein] synthase III C-terminal domain-containing protein [Bacteroidota bacterium]|nr:3-oxoacyl-[acyl-carrier-protein] synthase III C-terminal domain-containing protein [Bacteroidota bacterium]